MRASKVKIRVDNSDGTFCEVEESMPAYVAQFLTQRLVMWESEWLMTSREHFAYQAEHIKLTKKLQDDILVSHPHKEEGKQK